MKLRPTTLPFNLVRPGWFVPALLPVLTFGWAALALAQTPEEHASHHPDKKAGAPAATTPAEVGPKPGTAKPDAMSGMGGAGGMGAMMKEMMGTPPQKAFYPSLMALPAVSQKQRAELQQQAEARSKVGAALLRQGAARIADPAANESELQEGAADARAGLQELESGQAARRALAEGRAPRAIALQWFQAEMNLASPTESDSQRLLLGVTPFHLFTMALLILFALAMVGMYFFKMRRAAALFGRLESKPGSPPPGEAPPLAGKTPPGDGKALSPPEGASPAPASPAAPPAAPGGDAAEIADHSNEMPPGTPVTANWRGHLRVGKIITETPNVKTFSLVPLPSERFLPFTFVPGQFLNLAFSIGGARMNRSYSIASSPTEREYVELTVRREPRGAVSRHIDDLLNVGDLVEAGGPVGRFTFDGTESDSIVLVSGGVGITPMMSITRYLTARSWPGEIFFIYTGRTPADIIFRDELTALQARNPKLHVAITVSRPEGTDWAGARGRITKEWLTQTVPGLASRRTHMCGPPAMMDAIKAIFAELGIPPDHLKMEAFGAVKPPAAAPGTAKPVGPATGPTVTFSKNSKSSKIRVDLPAGDSPPLQSILELSEELAIGIEFSCRVGTCGVCKVKMTSGSVDQEVRDALDDGDKAKGIIIACQAKPTSDVMVEA